MESQISTVVDEHEPRLAMGTSISQNILDVKALRHGTDGKGAVNEIRTSLEDLKYRVISSS